MAWPLAATAIIHRSLAPDRYRMLDGLEPPIYAPASVVRPIRPVHRSTAELARVRPARQARLTCDFRDSHERRITLHTDDLDWTVRRFVYPQCRLRRP